MRNKKTKLPFNQSKYKYNPATEGFGTPEEWAENFRTQVLGQESHQNEYQRTLGVSTDATRKEVRDAYIRLAMIHHPDKNPNDVAASTEKMRDLTAAYNYLYSKSKI